MQGDLSVAVIEKIEALASKANDARIVAERPTGDVAVRADGKIAWTRSPDTASAHTAEMVGAFCRLVDSFDSGHTELAPVYVSATGASFVPGDSRGDCVRMPIEFSHAWKTLANISGIGMNQRDFIRMLRIDLAGTGAEALLAKVRNIKWTNESQRDIQHAKDEMGRKVTAEVLGHDALDTDLVLSVRPLRMPWDMVEKVQIPCAVEVFPELQQIALTPLPTAFDDAAADILVSCMEQIGEGLQAVAEDRGAGKPERLVVLGDCVARYGHG